MAIPKRHVVVLGAGISGLQTSLSLLQHGHRVTIVAAHTPGDFSPTYTSPWAGGHWRSHAGTSPSDAALRGYDSRTYQAWTQMLNSENNPLKTNKKEDDEKAMGIGFRSARYYWGKDIAETKGRDGTGVWFRDVVSEFGVLDLEEMRKMGQEKVPESALMGIKYKSICFDPLQYLLYLFKKVQQLSVRVIKVSVNTGSGLSGVIKSVQALIENEGIEEAFALVLQHGTFSKRKKRRNCTRLEDRLSWSKAKPR
jgi:D-amino-acid oxidase